jgi:hypothetical protein
MARPILQLQATNEELLELNRMVRGMKVSVGDRFRAKIILIRLEGKPDPRLYPAWHDHAFCRTELHKNCRRCRD